ncbi:MAG TPA: MlaD family protein [Verrucomicrobiae bacterium]|jgi:phospholipid/cholesterol/gamma-HCH transport system substrate-binding protein|nr:MlaD family protein [Verrucomicrobiae bacterium]
MDKKHLEWRVGLFVFVALVVLGALLLQFSKGTSIFRPTYELYLKAGNVGGLKKETSVLMAGVPIGMVSDVEMNPEGTNVTITLKIFKKYVVHKDARILIEQSGFLGDEYVAIVPTHNEGDVWQSGDHPTAEEPFSITEVARSAAGFLKRIDQTTKSLDDAIADVRRLVLNEQTLTNLSATVANARLASEHAVMAVDNINSIVQTNTASVGAAVSNIVYFSQQIDQFGGDLKEILGTNGATLTASMKNIEASTVVLKDVLEDVQSGKGLAGTVLRNQQLATNVNLIASNLSITTSNLNRLGLWHFLWHKEIPVTNNAAGKKPPR